MYEKQKVQFFFVGVGKCGTSWIYEFLYRHKPIGVPSIKEPYLIDCPPEKRNALVERLYQGTDEKLADFSNVYYWDPENPQKIKEYNPEAKIIITTRRPSDRIVSHFGFMCRSGLVEQDQLARYIDEGDPYSIVKRSDYRPVIERYIEAFGRDNVLVLPLEQLNTNPQLYADRLTNFLSVSRILLTEDDKAPVLKAASARSPAIARVVKGTAVGMRYIGLLKLLGALKRNKLIRKALYKPAKPLEDASFGQKAGCVELMDAAYPDLLKLFGSKF